MCQEDRDKLTVYTEGQTFSGTMRRLPVISEFLHRPGQRKLAKHISEQLGRGKSLIRMVSRALYLSDKLVVNNQTNKTIHPIESKVAQVDNNSEVRAGSGDGLQQDILRLGESCENGGSETKVSLREELMYPLGGLPVLETQSTSVAFLADTSVQLIN
ncbi:hypothetical protein BDV98DRAFT_585214 [Pterulicium gracile]|uniref:Uncharacterized protein n=1 Tax=Pterulicium gracile TaxID=1884261 RepID=A0A5C3QAB6_9AGAR|nr:hypothetical protein BDV98DRAFT_585214 [Pterula gracilis]